MKILRYSVENRWVGLAIVLAAGVWLRYFHLAEVPNGYFHDEAWSAVKAAAIVSGEAPPRIYFAENNGMDAAHVYGVALLYLFTGPLALGSRLVSSLAGSLTILATHWAAWELVAEERSRHGLSLIAAFVVATLFWALTTSRSAWHVPWMTLTITLSLAALFRGRRLRRRRWFAAAGLLAGLSQYTYPSARFLPVLLVLIAAMDLWSDRAARQAVVIHYLALFAAAVIVFAPLGVYFVQNPEWFFVRAQQTVGAPASELGQNIVKTLAGFSVYGDSEGLHNLIGRPALDPILTIFFVVGLAACLAGRHPAHRILMAWLIVFSLPVVLTGQAPLFRRWTGILSAEAMVIALGAVRVAQLAHDRLARRPGYVLGPVAVSAALVVSAGLSVAGYFGAYASSPHLFWAYDSGITQVANYIRAQPDATVFLTPYDRFYEVVDITLSEARPRRTPIQSYNGAACAVFPETTSRGTEWVVVTEKDERTLPLMQQLFPAGTIVWQLDSPAGTYARALRVPASQTAQLELEQRRQADFGGKVQLVGYELAPIASVGNTLNVTIALKNVRPLDRPYKVFVHVRADDDTVLAQADRLPCNFTLNEADWRPGDIVLESYDIAISAETPPGQYHLALGLYRADSGARLSVLASELDHTADSVLLGDLEVQ